MPSATDSVRVTSATSLYACPPLTTAKTPTSSATSFDHHYYTLSCACISPVKSCAGNSLASEESSHLESPKVPKPMNLHPEFNHLHGHAASYNFENSPNSQTTPLDGPYFCQKVISPCNRPSPIFPSDLQSDCFFNNEFHICSPVHYYCSDSIKKRFFPAREKSVRFKTTKEEWSPLNCDSNHWLDCFLMSRQSGSNKQESRCESVTSPDFQQVRVASENDLPLPSESRTKEGQVTSSFALHGWCCTLMFDQ